MNHRVLLKVAQIIQNTTLVRIIESNSHNSPVVVFIWKWRERKIDVIPRTGSHRVLALAPVLFNITIMTSHSTQTSVDTYMQMTCVLPLKRAPVRSKEGYHMPWAHFPHITRSGTLMLIQVKLRCPHSILTTRLAESFE